MNIDLDKIIKLEKFKLSQIKKKNIELGKNEYFFDELFYCKNIIKEINNYSDCFYKNNFDFLEFSKFPKNKSEIKGNENLNYRKYMNMNINFDLVFLSNIFEEKNKKLEEYDEFKNVLKIIDYFFIFAKKLFYLYNHINYKVLLNNMNFKLRHKEAEYKILYEEIYDNFSKIEFDSLKSFLISYWNIEKDNIFQLKGNQISIITAFSEYKPQKKDEYNKLELILIRNKEHIIIGEDYYNYYKNFFQDNIKLINLLKKFDISLENSKNFIEKINKNNPFKKNIISNYLLSNNLNLDLLDDTKMSYLSSIPLKNLNEYNIKIFINLNEKEINTSNDDIYFEILQNDFNLVFGKIVDEIRNKENNNILLYNDERKNLKFIENNVNKISSSILPILVYTENEKLICLMDRYLKHYKTQEINKQKLLFLNKILEKKNFYLEDSNEYKKYELIESFIDDENSDLKIQEIFKNTIENLLKEKLKK